ncbi:WG repeat-containing protein [Flavobacterium geliluteum]|uniref:WG repeat-containing protein n=1 Tax=Flavobacterium geliluteum TaxID=2816120 RepID=A0A941B1I6_9FLAO|nr:WG repeat-containing protein [Flavobacterium geliluteum]MBP4136483.1 WG repeat-containing protein [Flavobacterium geliluteum]
MKQFIPLYIFVCFTFNTFAQNKDTWIAFQNTDSTLTGFKDSNGNIKIAPKFMGMTIAHKFDAIMVVSEETNATWKSYYLTKSGKIVGRDSLYIYDNGPDCENEGFIRFKDYKTDKMGLFNSDGKIVIPAQYSNITRVRNGMIIALKDATKTQDGEHYFWSGGKEYLIDTTNKVLVENFAYTDELNFYSLEKSKEQNPDPTRDHFLGVDGLYYSFINFDKEFKAWLKNNLLSDVSKDNLIKNSFDKITYWKEPNGWVTASKTKFIGQNYTFIKLKLQELNAAKTDYFVSSDGLNKFIFETSEYKTYFNNCNEPKDWQYPVKNIVISNQDKKDYTQDHFEFLRTEKGYQLISVSSGKKALK